MVARGSIWTTLGCGLLLAFLGCKSGQPNLKPPAAPEVLNKPPEEARFNSPAYPKQALVGNDDPTKKWAPTNPAAMNPRSMGMGGGPGGMAGAGGFGR